MSADDFDLAELEQALDNVIDDPPIIRRDDSVDDIVDDYEDPNRFRQRRHVSSSSHQEHEEDELLSSSSSSSSSSRGERRRRLNGRTAATMLGVAVFVCMAMLGTSLQGAGNDSSSLAMSSHKGFFFQAARGLWELGRRLANCDVSWPHAYADYNSVWEELYGVVPTDDVPPEQATGERENPPPVGPSIAYVVTILSCPERKSYQPLKPPHDPVHAFYDAAALLKHSICTVHETSTYNFTMKAIVHPDAIECLGPHGELYDRVSILEEIGYEVREWGAQVTPAQISEAYVADNIQNDVGYRDMTRLQAFKLELHPVTILVNFETLFLKNMDSVLDAFIADPMAQVVWTKNYATVSPPTTLNGGINMGLLLIKRNYVFFQFIRDLYTTTAFNPTNGWGNSGVVGYDGVLGTAGIMQYYFGPYLNDPSVVMELDKCLYMNEGEAAPTIDYGNGTMVCADGESSCSDCRTTPIGDIVVAELVAKCGAPWDCYYDDSWAVDSLCRDMILAWSQLRVDFENSHWFTGPPSYRNGTFHDDIYLGFCHAEGSSGYDRMIPDKTAPTACGSGSKITVTDQRALSGSITQVQELAVTTLEFAHKPETCVNGFVRTPDYEPPFNVAFVIDVSGSTGNAFAGSAVGDTNLDGAANKILDAEIASLLEFLQTIVDTDGLDNDTVDIGVITFSTWAQYRGRFSPLDPNDSSQINSDLENELRSLRSGGWTHFDDALDKAVDYFNEAPSGRTNIMIFLSDGIPNAQGDGDNEGALDGQYTNNRPEALMYDSEFALLDAKGVQRIGIGVGTGSDVSAGMGLDLIDNTPDPYTGDGPIQVTTTDALTDVLTANPVVGTITSFEIVVNGVTQVFGVNDVVGGPVGWSFGPLVVGGINTTMDAINTVQTTVSVTYSGAVNTMSTTQDVIGSLLSGYQP